MLFSSSWWPCHHGIADLNCSLSGCGPGIDSHKKASNLAQNRGPGPVILSVAGVRKGESQAGLVIQRDFSCLPRAKIPFLPGQATIKESRSWRWHPFRIPFLEVSEAGLPTWRRRWGSVLGCNPTTAISPPSACAPIAGLLRRATNPVAWSAARRSGPPSRPLPMTAFLTFPYCIPSAKPDPPLSDSPSSSPNGTAFSQPGTVLA